MKLFGYTIDGVQFEDGWRAIVYDEDDLEIHETGPHATKREAMIVAVKWLARREL